MSAASLLRQGQRLLAHEFPAVIKINGQCYDCATSGLRAGFELGDGSGKAQRKIAFSLMHERFTQAGQPEPRPMLDFDCTAPDGLAGPYRVDEVLRDPSGELLILSCTALAQ